MKLGIIGSGNIVVDCLDAVKNIEGIELAGICVREKSLDKGKELAEKYSISKVYTEYEEILNDKNIDTVYIGIVNNMHFVLDLILHPSLVFDLRLIVLSFLTN